MRSSKILLVVCVVALVSTAVFFLVRDYGRGQPKPSALATSTTVGEAATSTLPAREAADTLPAQWGLQVFPTGSYEPLEGEAVRSFVTSNSKLRVYSSVGIDVALHTNIMAWAQCAPGELSADVCDGYIGLFDSDLKLLKKAPLPHALRAWSADGFDFNDLGIALNDVNNDGVKDFILTYTVTEFPRPAVGSRFEEIITVFDTRDLHVIWSAPIKTGGADVEKSCSTSIKYSKDGCDGAALISTFETCNAMRYCADDPDENCVGVIPTHSVNRYVWSSVAKKFTLRKTVPASCILK